MQSEYGIYQDFEAAWHDLDDQVARNKALGIDLEYAHDILRAQSRYWQAASLFSFVIVFGLGVVAFAPLRVEAILLQTYIGQTIVTTMLALALSAAVACFLRFVALRRLAGEASHVCRSNHYLIMDARAFLEKRH